MGVKISALPDIAVPDLTDVFPVVQDGVTYKETITQLSTLLGNIGVTSITGTANEVLTTASTGDITLSLPQAIGTTSNVTFGSLAFSPATNGIVGTASNNNAGAGFVGEFISAVVLIGAAVAMTTNTATTITSISLTAGDWDVWGTLWTSPSTGTVTTTVTAGVSQTSATFETTPAIGASVQQLSGISSTAPSLITLGAPVTRISLAAPATIYLIGLAIFTVSTMAGFGSLLARRVR